MIEMIIYKSTEQLCEENVITISTVKKEKYCLK